MKNKKAKGGAIIIVLILAVAGWYFFIADGGIHNPLLSNFAGSPGESQTYLGFQTLQQCQQDMQQRVNSHQWWNCGFNNDPYYVDSEGLCGIEETCSCQKVWNGTGISSTYQYTCGNQGNAGILT